MAAVRSSTLLLAALSVAAGDWNEPHCPGGFMMPGYGPVSLVPTGWKAGDGGQDIDVVEQRQVLPHMGARAYFADECTAGDYDVKQYLSLNLLGKRMRYTVNLHGAECGCNVAMYLVSMPQNTDPTECGDYYCDANKVCGQACTEIDIQEANLFSWHTTLHGKDDTGGKGKGYGGGGWDWNNDRDWDQKDYGPDGRCIDTKKPFQVAVTFPVNAEGSLESMSIELTQYGHACSLSLTIDEYKNMPEISSALAQGMTPVVSYWKDNDMLWMDGQGKDHQGPCPVDTPYKCADTVAFSGFAVESLADDIWLPTTTPTTPAPPAVAEPAFATAPLIVPTAPPEMDELVLRIPASAIPAGFSTASQVQVAMENQFVAAQVVSFRHVETVHPGTNSHLPSWEPICALLAVALLALCTFFAPVSRRFVLEHLRAACMGSHAHLSHGQVGMPEEFTEHL